MRYGKKLSIQKSYIFFLVLYPDSDPGGQDYLILCSWEKLYLGIFISWAIIKAHMKPCTFAGQCDMFFRHFSHLALYMTH